MDPTKPMTAEELEDLGPAFRWFELVDGIPVERGTLGGRFREGGRFGEIGAEIVGQLVLHLRSHPLGRLYLAGTRFVLDDRSVVIPTVAFVRFGRLPPDHERVGPLRVAPDLVVEFVSPDDRYTDVTERVERYRLAGVPLTWLIAPTHRTVYVVAGDPGIRTVRETENLDGGDVLPGFRLPVADIFR